MRRVVLIRAVLMSELSTKRLHSKNRQAYKVLRDSLTSISTSKYTYGCRVHFERTLDEAYSPGLNTDQLQTRNEDQIVSSRYIKDPRWLADDVPILIVPQLWI